MFARAAKSDSTVMAAIAAVVFVAIDCEKGDGPVLAEKYMIRAYPTYLMVDAAGQMTDAWVGYPGPEKWAAYAQAGGVDRRTIEDKAAAYALEPTLALAQSLANHASATSKYRESVDYLRRARELDPAGAKDYTQEILYSLYYGSSESVFTVDEIRAEADYAFAAEGTEPGDKVDLAQMLTAVAENMEDPQMAVPYIEAGLQASQGVEDEEVAAGRIELEISHALIATKDKAKALELKKSTLDADWREDLRTVNRFAYWCFQNEVNLEEARQLVADGIEKAEDDAMRNRFLNTAAELAHLDGRPGDAVAYVKRILETDPERGYFQRQLVRFEEALAARNEG